MTTLTNNKTFKQALSVFTSTLILLLSTTGHTICQQGADNCSLETRHPVVLIHGFMGWDNIGPWDHFYQIANDLSSKGTVVQAFNISSSNDIAYRGEQLIPQIEAWMDAHGYQKVNLIGHSLGAPTARYVAAHLPNRIASVSSVHGVNAGSNFADVVQQNLTNIEGYHPENGSLIEDAIHMVDLFAAAIDFLSDINSFNELKQAFQNDGEHSFASHVAKQNTRAALEAMTTERMRVFNNRYPAGQPNRQCAEGTNGSTPTVAEGPAHANVNGHDIYYFAWGGQAATAHFKGFWTNILDIPDALVNVIPGKMITAHGNERRSQSHTHYQYDGHDYSDGMISLCDQGWGNWSGTYMQSHQDGINQFFGFSPWWWGWAAPKPKSIYQAHMSRLRYTGPGL